MKHQFIKKRFNASSRLIIDQANDIIVRYERQRLRLTLRQLYYQFVASCLLENSDKNYKRLASIVSDARLAGEIDWDAIEDRGRTPIIPEDFSSPELAIKCAAASYRRERWRVQPHYREIWVEKQALAGVLSPLAFRYHVPLVVNKGYSSSSAIFESAQRIVTRCWSDVEQRPKKPATIFYIGDHDPSGEDMVRDVRERVNLLTGWSSSLWGVNVKKIALTMAQIEELEPPPNPAKIRDSRYSAYARKYGDESWEVDALSPTQLQALVTEALDGVTNRAIESAELVKERADKLRIEDAAAWLEDGA